jgi:flagellum-specific peptidoglycan hydrolase FlgJ
MKILVTLIVVLNGLLISPNDNSPEVLANKYIENFHELAVIEMHRSGIPASIILAQGLHESNNGTSDLATIANNHFGIKCKSYWQGDTYYHKDDDYDNYGKLKDSCFRKYGSSLESFVDHSNFLMNTSHYQVLFKNEKYDYQSWAKGLKICGYATDPNYSNKLIKLVEKYKLSQYDYWENPFRSSLK